VNKYQKKGGKGDAGGSVEVHFLGFKLMMAEHGVKSAVIPPGDGPFKVFQQVNQKKTGNERDEDDKGELSLDMAVDDCNC